MQNLVKKIISSITIFVSLGMITGYDEVIKLGEIIPDDSAIYMLFKTAYLCLFTLLASFLFYKTILQEFLERKKVLAALEAEMKQSFSVLDALNARKDICDELDEIQNKLLQGTSLDEHREVLLELHRRILALQPILGDRDEHPPWANNQLKVIADLLGDEASPVITH